MILKKKNTILINDFVVIYNAVILRYLKNIVLKISQLNGYYFQNNHRFVSLKIVIFKN